MAKTSALSARATPAEQFRRQIDAALASGARLEDMVLRLTRIDASKLKRDPQVGLNDIRFEPSGMHFLGVRVDEGGVLSSILELVDPVSSQGTKSAKTSPAAEKPWSGRSAKTSAART